MRRGVLAMAGLLGLALPAAAQADFNVDVNLVVLRVAVQNRKGAPIANLPQSVFQVYENGVPQTIKLFQREDVPVAVGLVVDNSGSMQRKLPFVVAAANTFAHSSNPQDQMFVVHFNEKVSMGLPTRENFTSNPAELNAAMLQIRANGETALYDAAMAALDHVSQSSLQKKVLIIVSDGGDNTSAHRFPEVLKALQQSGVIVYTVGIFDEYDQDRNPRILKQLAKVSGGEAYFPKDYGEVTGVLREISRDIRNQYTVGYVPSGSAGDGSYRTIKVKVTAPHSSHWTVRTRTGYFAGSK